MKKILYFLLVPFIMHTSLRGITICTAANENYFTPLLNFIGSLHKENFTELTMLLVYDLGLTEKQIEHLRTIAKLEIHSVRKIHPDILKPVNVYGRKSVPGWYAWKPVVIKQALEKHPTVLWIDAGATVLKSLVPLYEYVEQNGYFLCTIGEDVYDDKYIHGIEWQTTKYVRNKYNLDAPENRHILAKEAVTACVVGVSNESANLFINELYDLAHNLRSFEDDGTCPNGFGCGRYEQALLGVIAYLKQLQVFRQDPQHKEPMSLTINGTHHPFYITWHGPYVNEKTCLYSSRWDLSHYDDYVKQIKYK